MKVYLQERKEEKSLNLNVSEEAVFSITTKAINVLFMGIVKVLVESIIK